MADFDETLNSILGNPAAMAQIAQLAQSFGGAESGSEGGDNPPPGTHSPAGPPEAHPPARPEGSPPPEAQEPVKPPETPDGAPQMPQTPPPLSALPPFSGFEEMPFLKRLLPLIQEIGGRRDSNARRLLYALRPYLRPARREKVERALQLARLYLAAKRFLAQREETNKHVSQQGSGGAMEA